MTNSAISPLSPTVQRRLSTYTGSLPVLLKKPLVKGQPIAYIGSPALGDTLIGLVTVNNLLRAGHTVDVYGDYAYALRDWFPSMRIYPAVSLDRQRELERYHTVLHMHQRPLSAALDGWHPQSVVMHHEPLSRFPIHEIDIQLLICRHHFCLESLVRSNGMQPLAGLVAGRYRNRVMIHPTSSAPEFKSWPAEKFLSLADKLHSAGYDPFFIVTREERPSWLEMAAGRFNIPPFGGLSEIAAYLYESSYFIGNDSGIGHLASSAGVPTVSLIVRNGVIRRWRPAWATGEVITPSPWLNPRPIREKFWKKAVSVQQVLAGLERLMLRTGRTLSSAGRD